MAALEEKRTKKSSFDFCVKRCSSQAPATFGWRTARSDSSSIEVFANDGLVVFSDCIFPSDQSQGLKLFAEGGSVTLNSLDVYQLNPAKFSNV